MSDTLSKKKKTYTGVVVSRCGEKTVKVTSSYTKPHPVYQKQINCETTMIAHDESNACAVGDKVQLITARPLSKTKRWRILSIVQKAPKSA
jgi:small subunit ribosomal protein S17